MLLALFIIIKKLDGGTAARVALWRSRHRGEDTERSREDCRGNAKARNADILD